MKSAGKVVYQQHSAVMYNCQERRKNAEKILISDRLLCKWNRKLYLFMLDKNHILNIRISNGKRSSVLSVTVNYNTLPKTMIIKKSVDSLAEAVVKITRYGHISLSVMDNLSFVHIDIRRAFQEVYPCAQNRVESKFSIKVQRPQKQSIFADLRPVFSSVGATIYDFAEKPILSSSILSPR